MFITQVVFLFIAAHQRGLTVLQFPFFDSIGGYRVHEKGASPFLRRAPLTARLAVLLEQKMSYRADDEQADDSAFQEQNEELENINGDLGTQNKAAYTSER